MVACEVFQHGRTEIKFKALMCGVSMPFSTSQIRIVLSWIMVVETSNYSVWSHICLYHQKHVAAFTFIDCVRWSVAVFKSYNLSFTKWAIVHRDSPRSAVSLWAMENLKHLYLLWNHFSTARADSNISAAVGFPQIHYICLLSISILNN